MLKMPSQEAGSQPFKSPLIYKNDDNYVEIYLSIQVKWKGDSAPQIGVVINICENHISNTLRAMVEAKLLGKDAGQQHLLPSPLLSDDIGLQLWCRINRLPDYYQTRDEIHLLEHYGAEIAQHFVDAL